MILFESQSQNIKQSNKLVCLDKQQVDRISNTLHKMFNGAIFNSEHKEPEEIPRLTLVLSFIDL